MVLVAEGDHLVEFPGGIYMKQRKRQARGIEFFARQMKHHHAVVANREEHHRIAEFGCNLAKDVNALILERLELGIWRNHML